MDNFKVILSALASETRLLLKQNFRFLSLASLMGVGMMWFGLYQTDSLTPGSFVIGGLQKYVVEFLFLSAFFAFLNLLGIRKKWALTIFLILYYALCVTDIVFINYFKERFGYKFLDVLDGGDYNFFKNPGYIALILTIISVCYLGVKKIYSALSRPKALFTVFESVILSVIVFLLPLNKILPAPQDFFVRHMLAPTPFYILGGMFSKNYRINTALTPELKTLAEKYNLFNPPEHTAGGGYNRVIVIAAESLSGKYIHSYNPAIPKEASPVFDSLIKKYPSAQLKPSVLSTMFGLNLLFSGHPNAELMLENAYPLSSVRTLKENGWHTVFLRGAREDYMDEDVHFKEAGFAEIYGRNYFEEQEKYKDYSGWWGLTDRKLFEAAAEYINDHKNEKLFLHILTLDMHSPHGRTDYFGQEYPVPPPHPVYEKHTMAAAAWRFDYDLGIFLDTLEKQELFDDKTLIVITPDHLIYASTGFTKLTKNYKQDTLPFILASKRALPPLTRDAYLSQTDAAPTILDLLGLPAQKGMFGYTLFNNTPRTVFDIKEDYIKIANADGTEIIPLTTKKGRQIMKLMNTVLE